MYQIFSDETINTTTFQRGNVFQGPLAMSNKYFFIRNKSSIGAGQYRLWGWVKAGDSFAILPSTALAISTLLKFSTNVYLENYALEVKADSVAKSVIVDAYAIAYTP